MTRLELESLEIQIRKDRKLIEVLEKLEKVLDRCLSDEKENVDEDIVNAR